MVIYIQYKFHEIQSIGYIAMAKDGKKSLKFRQKKGDNSTIPDDSPIKPHHIMVIYIQYKLHDILYVG